MWAGGCKVRNGSSGGDGGRGEGVGKSDTANVSENLAPCNHIWMQLQKFRRDLMSNLGSCVGRLLLQSAYKCKIAKMSPDTSPYVLVKPTSV